MIGLHYDGCFWCFFLHLCTFFLHLHRLIKRTILSLSSSTSICIIFYLLYPTSFTSSEYLTFFMFIFYFHSSSSNIVLYGLAEGQVSPRSNIQVVYLNVLSDNLHWSSFQASLPGHSSKSSTQAIHPDRPLRSSSPTVLPGRPLKSFMQVVVPGRPPRLSFQASTQVFLLGHPPGQSTKPRPCLVSFNIMVRLLVGMTY